MKKMYDKPSAEEIAEMPDELDAIASELNISRQAMDQHYPAKGKAS